MLERRKNGQFRQDVLSKSFNPILKNEQKNDPFKEHKNVFQNAPELVYS